MLAGMQAFREAATLKNLVGYGTIRDMYNSVGFFEDLHGEKAYHDEYGNVIAISGRSFLRTTKFNDMDYEVISLWPDGMREVNDYWREIAECLDRDFLKLDAGEIVGAIPYDADDADDPDKPTEVVRLLLELGIPVAEDSGGFYLRYLEYSVTSSYTETLAWFDMYCERIDEEWKRIMAEQ
jgi:hypothetical protein